MRVCVCDVWCAVGGEELRLEIWIAAFDGLVESHVSLKLRVQLLPHVESSSLSFPH